MDKRKNGTGTITINYDKNAIELFIGGGSLRFIDEDRNVRVFIQTQEQNCELWIPRPALATVGHMIRMIRDEAI